MSGATITPISYIDVPEWLKDQKCNPCEYAKTLRIPDTRVGETDEIVAYWLPEGTRASAFIVAGQKHTHAFDFDGTLLGAGPKFLRGDA